MSLTSPNLTNSFLWVLIRQLLVRYRINPSLPFSFPKYRLYNRSDLNPFSGFSLSIYGDRVCRGLPNEPSKIWKLKVLKMFIECFIKNEFKRSKFICRRGTQTFSTASFSPLLFLYPTVPTPFDNSG